jgi:hypothetical protein
MALKTNLIALKLSDAQLAKMKRQAEAKHITLSEAIRQAIDEAKGTESRQGR